MADLEATVRAAVDLIARGEYATLEAASLGRRVPAEELDRAIGDYGRILVSPPVEWWHMVEVTPIVVPPGGFHVAAPLWTAEEGRSDLTLELDVRESDGEYVIAEILGLHVL